MPTTYSPEDLAILRRHVSDVEGDVYAIFNLPEEVVAVIFAYVSRSPDSFRDNLLKLIKGRDVDIQDLMQVYASGDGDRLTAAQEKARDFHDKWVVGYGHSSVAEHAVAHVGVERISRLASAELELANPFLSFTEYSQRYQRPRRGAYFTPGALEKPERAELLAAYREFQEAAYDTYEQLQEGLLDHLLRTSPRLEEESETRRRSRLEKLSFEDARYALPLAVHTNLGLTGNGRALRDAIVRLFSDPYPETTALAGNMKREVRKVLPTLLKYAEANAYQTETREILALSAAAAATQQGAELYAAPGEVRLLDWTGRAGADAAFTRLLADLLYPYGTATPEELAEMLARRSQADREALFAEAVRRLGPHDLPHDAFAQITYRVEFIISEANWHQLLRHSRRIRFLPQPASDRYGFTIPPNVEAAGLAEPLREIVSRSQEFYRQLLPVLGLEAQYVVTNAQRRRVVAHFDLWELLHLVRLRGKADAQWDIRATVWRLWEQVLEVHPFLAPLTERLR